MLPHHSVPLSRSRPLLFWLGALVLPGCQAQASASADDVVSAPIEAAPIEAAPIDEMERPVAADEDDRAFTMMVLTPLHFGASLEAGAVESDRFANGQLESAADVAPFYCSVYRDHTGADLVTPAPLEFTGAFASRVILTERLYSQATLTLQLKPNAQGVISVVCSKQANERKELTINLREVAFAFNGASEKVRLRIERRGK